MRGRSRSLLRPGRLRRRPAVGAHVRRAEREGIAVAAALGRALQLTNILRDLREDAGLGRLYLPDELLTAHGIDGRDPECRAHSSGVARGLRSPRQTGAHAFRCGRPAMVLCPRPAMRPARLMEAMYRGLLDRMEARAWQISRCAAQGSVCGQAVVRDAPWVLLATPTRWPFHRRAPRRRGRCPRRRRSRAAQRADGHWAFPLEADATISAEYVLLLHYLDERDPASKRASASTCGPFRPPNMAAGRCSMAAISTSARPSRPTIALKAIGDDIDAPHMVRAREAILDRGGAANANVFTRIMLALFGQVPWRAVPVMPVEIMLLPRWFPFHLDKVSYWSRTVIVPLLVLDGDEATREEPRSRRHPRTLRHAAGAGTAMAQELCRIRHGARVFRKPRSVR